MLVGLRSRRQIAPFVMRRPTTVEEAVTLRRGLGQAAYIAGGIDLIDWLKCGNALDHLIRLDGIPELSAISAQPNALRIGAMITHEALAANDVVRARLPDLPPLWHSVANPRVRFTGTIGGNVMARRPDYDALPALLALGAEADIATPAGQSRARLDALDGLVTAFLIPEPGTQRLFADRSLRPAVSVWVGMTVVDGHVRALRIAVGMAYPQPMAVGLRPDMPLAAVAANADSLADQVRRTLPEPTSGPGASAGYRSRMIGVLTRRLLVRAGAAA